MALTPTPFIVQIEGLAFAPMTFFTYHFSTSAVVNKMAVTARGVSDAATVFDVFKNGVATGVNFTLQANVLEAPPQTFSDINFATSDVLSLQIVAASGNTLADGVTVVLYWNYVTDQAILGDFYSDPYEDLLIHVKAFKVGDARLATLSSDQFKKYQRWADEFINSRLNSLYFVPFTTIVRNLVAKYPDPIPEIARKLVVGYAALDIYSEVEPNKLTAAQDLIAIATKELDRVANQEFYLTGQRRKSRNPGSNPYTEPSKLNNQPPNLPPAA